MPSSSCYVSCSRSKRFCKGNTIERSPLFDKLMEVFTSLFGPVMFSILVKENNLKMLNPTANSNDFGHCDAS